MFQQISKLQGISLATVLTVAISSASQAELPAAVATAFTALSTDMLALIDLAWTVAIPVTVGFIILGMFSRTARSAVS